MISITISCEETPELKEAIYNWILSFAQVARPAQKERSDTVSTLDKKLEKVEKVTKQLRRSHTDPPPILSMGEHPANFIEAPIGPKELEPPDPGRNKYGRWEGDVPPEVDAEIVRLREKGLTTRSISIELARQGITLDYKRVRGRLSAMARERNKAEAGKDATVRGDAQTTTNVSDTSNVSDVSEDPRGPLKDLDGRLLEMYSRLTLKEISAELEKEGIDLTPKEISQKVKEIQLREIGAKAGQTVERQVPEQVKEAESIPTPIDASIDVPMDVAERTDCTESIKCTPEPPPEKFVTPAKINGEIWDLTKAGLTPKDISEHLQLRGLLWTEGMVEKRLERIRVEPRHDIYQTDCRAASHRTPMAAAAH